MDLQYLQNHCCTLYSPETSVARQILDTRLGAVVLYLSMAISISWMFKYIEYQTSIFIYSSSVELREAFGAFRNYNYTPAVKLNINLLDHDNSHYGPNPVPFIDFEVNPLSAQWAIFYG